ncbi:MFS transporter [Coralloluteibacterium stylophorae]|uniref:MFS transporter n=1 Tax=Coralloluteibacterium stylophorae TaxID=1776034 RepID=A0A8J7VX46_9GAMM|nr:MFS transporter [Coralloluteibacterium stylophorae]MBS7456467.1 MFS transporter [Coralloluteibacterium stylophorae]
MPTLRRTHPADLPPVQRRELWAWAGYDFANSGYTTVVITAVFNAYFVRVVADGADWATFAWTLALSLSYLLVAVTAPALGAWADLRARKKFLLAITTAVCVAGTAALAACGPGSVALAIALVVVTNAAFGTGENVIAAFLPELASEDGMGRLSGYGWGFGYVGGLLILGVCLWWIMAGAAAFGVDASAVVPQTMLITAAAFLLAALPTLLVLRERARPQPARSGLWRTSFARLRQALLESEGLIDLRRFLLCIVCYQAGVMTVITIAAIFTEQALGFSTTESIVLIMVVNVTAAVGALVFGLVQDRLGHRPTLAITLVAWLAAIGLFWFAEDRRLVWVAANVAGLALGASQSAGRALVGYLCPARREAEVFGLWGLAVKLSSVIGPLAFGAVSWASGGDYRIAMLATSLFFVAGLAILATVDVPRGRAAARVADAAIG